MWLYRIWCISSQGGFHKEYHVTWFMSEWSFWLVSRLVTPCLKTMSSSSSIVKTTMVNKAIYMKDLNGHFWISKWSPEQKLQRLILDGNLMKAKQFADHYGLEGETIKQKELEYLVRQDQKHSRIQKLLNEIQGMASKISNIFLKYLFTKISLGSEN